MDLALNNLRRLICHKPKQPAYQSSFLDDLYDGRQVVVQPLFCWVLFPGFNENSMQLSCVVPIKLFLDTLHLSPRGTAIQ